MQFKIISNIFLKIYQLLAGIALLSSVFLFFILKSRFLKMASMKAYAISFYSFVFYIVAAFSFVGMNAVVRFFYLPDHFFSNLFWIFPYTLISAAFGALAGYIIFIVAKKLAAEFVYSLLNISLLILTPMLCFVLLFKPYLEMVNIAIGPEIHTTEKTINEHDFEILNKQIEQIYFPSTPADFHDSLSFQIIGKAIQISSKQNGFAYSQKIKNKEVSSMYTCDSKNKEYLAVLLVYSILSGESECLVFDREGKCVFNKLYQNQVNRMSIGEDGRSLLLQKQVQADQLNFVELIQFK